MRELLKPVIAAVMAAVLGHFEAGCLEAVSPDVTYPTQIAACAASAKTLAESCYCRQNVDLTMGVCEDPDRFPGNSCGKDCGSL